MYQIHVHMYSQALSGSSREALLRPLDALLALLALRELLLALLDRGLAPAGVDDGADGRRRGRRGNLCLERPDVAAAIRASTRQPALIGGRAGGESDVE